jgi:glycosyltransferase involved in cell wall biosynthesis
MKIIQVCPRYYPDIGGVETHVKEISERLVKRGFEVEVVCTKPFLKKKSFTKKLFFKKETFTKEKIRKKAFSKKKKCDVEIIKGVTVMRFRSIAPSDAYFFAPQIYFYLTKAKCDVIHAHSYHALPAFFAALAKNDRKFVFTSHYHGRGHTILRNILHTPYKFIGSRIFRKADRVICVSRYEKELTKGIFGLSDEKLVCVPNGVNLEEFRTKDGVKDKKTILYVGRLERYKRVQHIIRALPYLDGYRLVIVGKGPYGGELRKLAFRIDVNGKIEWLKDLSREELLEQYKSAGVFVFLSSFEAFGITVAEALASGTPCIVAETGALKEFIDEKICFGLRNPENVNELAEKIIEVSNLKLKINLSDLPKDKIKIRSWDEVVDEHEKIYEELNVGQKIKMAERRI